MGGFVNSVVNTAAKLPGVGLPFALGKSLASGGGVSGALNATVGNLSGGMLGGAGSGGLLGSSAAPGLLGTGMYGAGESWAVSPAQGLTSTLANQINGQNGPSLPQLQLQKAQSDALKAASSQAASTRGVSDAGLVARNLSQQEQGIQLGNLNTFAQQSVQQQLGSESALSNLLNGQTYASNQLSGIQSGAYNNAAQNNQGLLKGIGTALGVGGFGKEGGGIIPGEPVKHDNQLVPMASGEMVLNMDQQKKLFDAINSGTFKPSEAKSDPRIDDSSIVLRGFITMMEAQNQMRDEIANLKGSKGKVVETTAKKVKGYEDGGIVEKDSGQKLNEQYGVEPLSAKDLGLSKDFGNGDNLTEDFKGGLVKSLLSSLISKGGFENGGIIPYRPESTIPGTNENPGSVSPSVIRAILNEIKKSHPETLDQENDDDSKAA